MIRSQNSVVFPKWIKRSCTKSSAFLVFRKTAGINYQTTVILFEQVSNFWYSSVELKDITCKFFLLMQR